MTTTAADRVFVDTSVWLHAALQESPHFESTREMLEPLLADSRVDLLMSGQVLP